MTREYLLAYLNTVDCYPDEDNNLSQGQLFRNHITGSTTIISYDNYLNLSAYCRIFLELMIDAPKENGYDSDYALFSSFIDK